MSCDGSKPKWSPNDIRDKEASIVIYLSWLICTYTCLWLEIVWKSILDEHGIISLNYGWCVLHDFIEMILE